MQGDLDLKPNGRKLTDIHSRAYRYIKSGLELDESDDLEDSKRKFYLTFRLIKMCLLLPLLLIPRLPWDIRVCYHMNDHLIHTQLFYFFQVRTK